jgi:hypothetical protein
MLISRTVKTIMVQGKQCEPIAAWPDVITSWVCMQSGVTDLFAKLLRPNNIRGEQI